MVVLYDNDEQVGAVKAVCLCALSGHKSVVVGGEKARHIILSGRANPIKAAR